jgi:hypothetical protein
MIYVATEPITDAHQHSGPFFPVKAYLYLHSVLSFSVSNPSRFTSSFFQLFCLMPVCAFDKKVFVAGVKNYYYDKRTNRKICAAKALRQIRCTDQFQSKTGYNRHVYQNG